MAGICYKCNESCVLRDSRTEVFGYPCDQCKRVVCKSCAGISSSEVRAVVITTRIMSFHCPLCRINNIPQITQRLNNIEQEIQDHSSNLNGKLVTLEQRILRIEQFIESNKLIEQRLLKIEQILDLNKSLQQRLSTLEQLVESPRASPPSQNNCEIGTNSSDCETFILEVEERKRRSTNLMVYNLPENDNPDVDKRKIGHVFKDIIPTDCIKKVFRIGKKSGNNVQRPLKLVLNDSHFVLTLLKNKDKISSPDCPC
ncbi:hypothetical protein JTB14_018052 [Gonioctena quinquepunctata]|nr:hypothetical protein JTB14_018052 [Gonioctena quinquepunctata]